MRTKVSTVNASQGSDGEASQQERSGSRTKVLSRRSFLLDMGFLAAATALVSAAGFLGGREWVETAQASTTDLVQTLSTVCWPS